MSDLRTSPVPHIVPALSSLLPAGQVSVRDEDLLTYARDMWPRGLLAVAAGQAPEHPPQVVVWPSDTQQVQAVVRLCRQLRVPLCPFGAGSGVCGGAVPAGGVVLDVKRMRRLCSVDPERGTATFEPGILGDHLERQLNRRSLTMGHFPSSIMCSTTGGWIATRGAGQCSTKYGKIEDMVHALEVVTGTGEVLELHRETHGPDLLQLVTGSEGTLGIITRATCIVRPLPQARRMRGWSFPDVATGCEAIRRILQRGLRPAVVRLYDEFDTFNASLRAGKERAPRAAAAQPAIGETGPLPGEARPELSPKLSLDDWLEMLRPEARRATHGIARFLLSTVLQRPAILNRLADRVGARLSGGCLLILGFEGDAELCAAEEAAAAEDLAPCGGRDLGPGPGEHWLRHRYDVSFKMPKAFAAGAFVDTMEVATTWDRLQQLYHGVREAAGAHAFVMAHFSHAYPEGCSIYFTFAGSRGAQPPERAGEHRRRADLTRDERRYDALWQAALQAVVRAGGTISHHHGVGLLKSPFMQEEHGAGMALYRALKQVMDPDQILNPGKMGLS